jgi:hypothetical protein
LTGTDTCAAGAITERGGTPVLALCRSLIAAGMAPDQALEVFRGATLALSVRSVGEAAQLDVNGKGTGFKPIAAVGKAPPMRSDEAAASLGGVEA